MTTCCFDVIHFMHGIFASDGIIVIIVVAVIHATRQVVMARTGGPFEF